MWKLMMSLITETRATREDLEDDSPIGSAKSAPVTNESSLVVVPMTVLYSRHVDDGKCMVRAEQDTLQRTDPYFSGVYSPLHDSWLLSDCAKQDMAVMCDAIKRSYSDDIVFPSTFNGALISTIADFVRGLYEFHHAMKTERGVWGYCTVLLARIVGLHSVNVGRVVIPLYIIAAKFIDDHPPSERAAAMYLMINHRELTRLEFQLLEVMQYRIWVRMEL